MAKAKDNKVTESVKLDVKVVDLVRGNKDKTGVPIGTFFEQAATEKLKQSTKK